MILKTTYIESNTFNPYYNLALEEYLISIVEKGEYILYLWQNKDTVVIGKNQNAWSQCNISLLNEDGGFLARRSSGGGAVFHDLGNVNFTFVAHNEDYDIQKQLDVIVKAVKSFGIEAEKTGRNDITVDGRKISGNAFQKGNEVSCHHGTLLINSDMEALSKYLNVSKKKLKAKGVDSVRSRVVNLATLGDVNASNIKVAVKDAFECVYGIKCEYMPKERLNEEEIAEIERKYASDEWRLGKESNFTCTFDERFEWGEVSICLNVEDTAIKNCIVYSDALDVMFIKSLETVLCNIAFDKTAMYETVLSLKNEENKKMVNDVADFIKQQNI